MNHPIHPDTHTIVRSIFTLPSEILQVYGEYISSAERLLQELLEGKKTGFTTLAAISDYSNTLINNPYIKQREDIFSTILNIGVSISFLFGDRFYTYTMNDNLAASQITKSKDILEKNINKGKVLLESTNPDNEDSHYSLHRLGKVDESTVSLILEMRELVNTIMEKNGITDNEELGSFVEESKNKLRELSGKLQTSIVNDSRMEKIDLIALSQLAGDLNTMTLLYGIGRDPGKTNPAYSLAIIIRMRLGQLLP